MRNPYDQIRKKNRGTVKALLAGALIMLAVCLPAESVLAVGTQAGTDITNQATATYSIGATNYTEPSNTTTTTVAEIIDVTVTWQDAADVTVSSGGTNEVLTFLVTNTGNGSEDFSLTADNALGTLDFNPDPAPAEIYEDTNGNGSYDSGIDQLITDTPSLVEDTSAVVFVLNDIPAGPLGNGDRGECQLAATSNTPTFGTPWNPGDTEAGAGQGGTDAVLGTTAGNGSIAGVYIVSDVAISVVKSATIADPFGTAEPIPGAVVTYTIQVSATGPGTATGVVITDPIPTNTTYNAGTLTLNATSLTDVSDVDAGDVGATTAGEVTVSLGDMDNTTALQTITFDVTID